MDGDPAVESELDSFSLTFPLPYREAFIIVLAVWAWGINLHYLYILNIDVPSLIRYPGRSSNQITHHFSTYRLATVLSTTYALSLLLFWIFTRRDATLVLAWDWLSLTYLLVLIAVFLAPAKRLSNSGRSRFLSTLKRISVGGIAEAKDGKFGDILLADVLTSYAKPLGDLYVALCMFFRTDGSATARPDRNCGGTVVVPLLLALPFLIRLRQCLIEYMRVRRTYPRDPSQGWGGQHLANALKYATAFPVIILNSVQRNGSPSAALYRAWLAACVVNSLYSFYWDVTKDWDLTLFSSRRERDAPDHALGLRRRLYMGPPSLYYGVIVLDLLLRCTWTVKLSSRLDHLTDFESSLFVMEFLEVFRRWVWIFFRVETEWIRNSSSGLDVDDILLGDWQQNSKYEDDD